MSTQTRYPSQMLQQAHIKMEHELHTRLKASAQRNHRTLNSEMTARLEASFGENPLVPGGTPTVVGSLDAEVAAAIERHVQAEVEARIKRIAGTLAAGGE